jgi:hypothetical protein
MLAYVCVFYGLEARGKPHYSPAPIRKLGGKVDKLDTTMKTNRGGAYEIHGGCQICTSIQRDYAHIYEK